MEDFYSNQCHRSQQNHPCLHFFVNSMLAMYNNTDPKHYNKMCLPYVGEKTQLFCLFSFTFCYIFDISDINRYTYRGCYISSVLF